MHMEKANGAPITDNDRLKYEIAAELGLLPLVLVRGWGGLTTAQSGRIGGIMQHRMRQKKE